MDLEQRTRADSGAVARAEELEPLLPDGTKKRILTGDRTTGKLHLGHYVGSLRNRVKYQHVYDTSILMADVQALTTHWDKPEVLAQSVRDVALDYMAIGMDPYTGGKDDGSKPKIVVQSHVPAIAELTVLYGLVTPMSLLEQNPTTKAEAEQYGLGGSDELLTESMAIDVGADEREEIRERCHKLSEMFPELGEVSPDDYWGAATSLIADKFYSHTKEQAGEKYQMRAIRDAIISRRRRRGLRGMSYGFLGYPVSQAADITFVGGHLVPVGDDQVPHIELTREIVRRFNKQYGEVLVMPQALVGSGTIKGLDGSAKMSKSLGNAVYLSDSDEEIWEKVRKAVTDPQRIKKTDPGRPEICNVYAYHEQFNAETEAAIAEAALSVPTVEETAELCRTAAIGCVECKRNLAAKLSAMLAPMRDRRSEWEGREDELKDILRAGTARGNEAGNATVERVKSAMHVDYWG